MSSEKKSPLIRAFESMSYAPASSESPAASWFDSRGRLFGHFIDNAHFTTKGRKKNVVLSGGEGEKAVSVLTGGEEEARKAVASCLAAQWAGLSPLERARRARSAAERAEKRAALLAAVAAAEKKLPLRECEERVRDVLRRSLSILARPVVLEGARPAKVVVIAEGRPYEAPLAFAIPCAEALAAGSTVVIVRAEGVETSLTALLWAEICAESGLPAGVVNVVGGFFPDYMTGTAGVETVAYAGRAFEGALLRSIVAGSAIKTSFEMEGRIAAIVYDSCDLDSSAQQIVDSLPLPAILGVKAFVHQPVYEAFIGKLKRRLAIRAENFSGDGEPALITSAATSSETACERAASRTVVVAIPFRTSKEVIALANNVVHGPKAVVFSEETAVALEAAHGLNYDAVALNSFRFPTVEGPLSPYLRYEEEAGVESDRSDPASFGTHSGGGSGADAKDVKAACATALKAFSAWNGLGPFERSRFLIRIADNIDRKELSGIISASSGRSLELCAEEADLIVERLLFWSSYAGVMPEETYGPSCGYSVRTRKPLGVICIACPNDDRPLLSLVSLLAPAIGRGNSVVAISGEKCSRPVAELLRVIAKSRLPAGVVNILTGNPDSLTKAFVLDREVAAIWYFGSRAGAKFVERNADETKRVWVDYGRAIDWAVMGANRTDELLRRATKIKSIYMPMGSIFAN